MAALHQSLLCTVSPCGCCVGKECRKNYIGMRWDGSQAPRVRGRDEGEREERGGAAVGYFERQSD
jgi:hypothetical protein